MRRSFFSPLLWQCIACALLIVVIFNHGSAQDYIPVRLTSDGAESTRPRLAMDDNYLYVAWQDTRSGSRQIWWAKYTWSGTLAAGPVQLSSSGDPVEPSVGVDVDGNSYVIWLSNPPYFGSVVGTKVDSDGNSLVAPKSVSVGLVENPELDVAPDGTCIVTCDRRSASDHNVHIYRLDSSLTQVCHHSRPGNAAVASDRPSAVAIDEAGVAHVVFRDTYFLSYFIQRYLANPSCGSNGDSKIINSDYTSPAIGWSGTQEWITVETGTNIYCYPGMARVNDVAGGASQGRVGDDPDNGMAVWHDNRDGNWEVYFSVFNGSTPFGDVNITNNASSQQWPDIATHPDHPGEFWAVWQDNRDGNNEIYMTSSYTEPVSLKIYDGGSPIQVVSERPCIVSRIEENGAETLIDTALSDTDGIVLLPPDAFSIGDAIKVEVVADTQLTSRPAHAIVDDIAHIIYADNGTVQSDGPILYNDTYQGVPGQVIELSHTTVKYNLLVVVQWDATEAQLQNIQQAFGMVANYLFDVTDGQATLGTVVIYDNGNDPSHTTLFEAADVKIYESNFRGGAGPEATWGYGGFNDNCSRGGVFLPRTIYSRDAKANAKLCAEHGVNWTISETSYLLFFRWYYPGIQGIAHELGHYLLYFGDEYLDTYNSTPARCVGDVPDYEFGLMDGSIDIDPSDDMFGEISTQTDYDEAGSNYTHQWCANSSSCWQKFENMYELQQLGHCLDDQFHVNTAIIKPSERGGSPLSGPNNDPENPDVDCAAKANIWYWNEDTGADETLLHVSTFKRAVTGTEARVQLRKGSSGVIIGQGLVPEGASLTMLGTHLGDTVFVYTLSYDSLSGEQTYARGWCPISTDNFGDTAHVSISPVTDTPLAVSLSLTSSTAFLLNADFETTLPNPPYMDAITSSGTRTIEQLSLDGSSYVSVSSVPAGTHGTIILSLESAFLLPIDYDLINAPTGGHLAFAATQEGAAISLDTTQVLCSGALCAQYSYDLPDSGLPTGALIVSRALSVSLDPSPEILAGENLVSMPYDIPDGSGIQPVDLSIYFWDSAQRRWVVKTSTVDTLVTRVTAQLGAEGLYVVATTTATSSCCTLRGDADGTGTLNVADLTFIANYLFKDGPAPACLDEADTDGSGSINIADITYFVAYLFKGGPAPVACP